MPAALDKVKLLVGIEPERTSVVDEMDQMCGLTKKQRLYGFGVCFVIGMILNVVAWFLIFAPVSYAVVFTFGNIISLCSSMFLCGPKKQFKNMTDKTRLVTTLVYLTFMILTLVCALKFHSMIGTIVCCCIQDAALFWYTLSYIPFARAAVSRIAGGAVGV